MPRRRGGGLTQKEEAFLDYYVGDCHWNATSAAVMAGYGRTRNSARFIGHKLLIKPHIREALEMRKAARAAVAILTAAERDAIRAAWVKDPTLDERFKLKVVGQLDKVEGRGSSRALQNQQGMTLAEAMGQSRQLEKGTAPATKDDKGAPATPAKKTKAG